MLLLLLVLVPALHKFFNPGESELRADEHIYGSDYDPDKGIFGRGYDPDPDEGINGSDYNPDEDINGSDYDADPDEAINGSDYDPDEDEGILGSEYDYDSYYYGDYDPACTGEGESVRGDGNCTLRPDCDLFGGELCCDSGEW